MLAGAPCADAILYAGEVECFAIRLHELDWLCDRFVVVEAAQTFQGDAKPFTLASDIAAHPELDLDRFLPRIRHVRIDAFGPHTTTAWAREAEQRNAVMAGLDDLPPESTVLLCDVDEVPRASMVMARAPQLAVGEKLRLGGPAYLYALNLRETTFPAWYGPVVVRRRTLDGESPQRLRGHSQGNTPSADSLRDSAWHFSFLGGPERMLKKLHSWSHTEDNHFATPEHIISAIAEQRDWKDDRETPLKLQLVALDASYPVWLRRNAGAFSALLIPLPEAEAEMRARLEVAE